MDKLPSTMETDSSASQVAPAQATCQAAEKRKNVFDRWILMLSHSGPCEGNCEYDDCHKFKIFVQHIYTHKYRTQDCYSCRKIIGICCSHAKHCRKLDCPVPYCPKIRKRFRFLQMKKQQEEHLMKMRNINQAELLRDCMQALSLESSPKNARPSARSAPTENP